MLKMKDILDEKDKRLRLVSKDVEFPLSKKDKETIEKMIELIKKGNFIEIDLVEEKNIPLKNDEYEFQILDY